MAFFAGVEHPRFRFKIPIDRGINECLVVALNYLSAVSCENDDLDDQTCKASGDTPQVQEPVVYISTILRSIDVHTDSSVDKNEKPLVPDGFKVGFVFLDDNDKGYFLHGQDKILKQRRARLSFSMVEWSTTPTAVPSGAKTPIHLLGPFTLTTDKSSPWSEKRPSRSPRTPASWFRPTILRFPTKVALIRCRTDLKALLSDSGLPFGAPSQLGINGMFTQSFQ
jgi:hypothetical protein